MVEENMKKREEWRKEDKKGGMEERGKIGQGEEAKREEGRREAGGRGGREGDKVRR